MISAVIYIAKDRRLKVYAEGGIHQERRIQLGSRDVNKPDATSWHWIDADDEEWGNVDLQRIDQIRRLVKDFGIPF